MEQAKFSKLKQYVSINRINAHPNRPWVGENDDVKRELFSENNSSGTEDSKLTNPKLNLTLD